MKEILIISYFFPPCNLTAAQRTFGWAKYLKNFGYFPIIITRNWDKEIKEPKDVSVPSGRQIKHIRNSDYEVYYIPFKGSIKDKIYSKYGENKMVVLRRFLSFVEILGQNFSNHFNTFKVAYKLSKKLISEKDIKLLIISGNPFIQFRFGYLLNKKFKLKWIADYRDDWTTDELNSKKDFLSRMIHYVDKHFEKKWVETSSRIVSVSPYYVNKISSFVGVPGNEVYNGFFEEEFLSKNDVPQFFQEITFTYNGTLYPTQNVEIFTEGFKKAITKLLGTKIQLYFPGLGFKPDQKRRIEKLLNGFEEFYIITNRISREEVLEIQLKSHALLMFPHKGIKGVPSSKLYEYLGVGKTVILTPSDNDIIEETIRKANAGVILNNSDEVCNYIVNFTNKDNWKPTNKSISDRMIYSRKSQTKRLSEIIDSIL
jgi:glycosyltransferase involved in cell wall biosynthesis